MSGPLSRSNAEEALVTNGHAQASRRVLFGLVRYRVFWIPTLRGWLAILAIGAALLVGAIAGLHPFLAVNDPRPGGYLVVEGWVPDHVIEKTIAEYEQNRYEQLLVTGGPQDKGAPLFEFGTIAEVGAATIKKLRPDLPNVYAVSAPKVRQDRTYTSAVALKAWLRERGQLPAKLNLVSGGPHSRRSRLLYQKAFGSDAEIGIIAMEDDTYDPKRWWASSQGFRVVTGEAIAYVYARFFFWP